MNSVIVRGMEMPKDCSKCPCFQYNMFNDDIDGYCKALKTKIIYSDEHRPSCPLIEIPTPHGRLVDADKLFEEINIADEYGADMSDILRLVIDAPTVIKAEG